VQSSVSVRSTAVPPPPAVRAAAAPRQWKPRQVLLAVLVVVLGGLVSMWSVSAYAHRDRVLVMAANVPVGARITIDDLLGADLTLDPRVAAFTVDQQGQVIGKVAVVNLAKGTLVNPSQIGASPLLTAGQVLVPLQLKPGQQPAVGVAPGQPVLVVPTPVDTAQGVAGGIPADPINATVAEAGEPDAATGVTVVDVRVPADQGGSLARMAAGGNVTVVVLPAVAGK
jgi:SAF domain